MNYLQEFKDLYYKELEFSNKMSSKISYSVTLLYTLGAGIIFLLNKIFPLTVDWIGTTFVISVITSVVLFIISIYRCYKTHTSCVYHYFPIEYLASEIETKDAIFNSEMGKLELDIELVKTQKNEDYFLDVERLETKIKDIKKRKEEYFISKIRDDFADTYLALAKHNTAQNNKKNENNVKFNNMLKYAFISVFISYLLWIIKTNIHNLTINIS